MTADNATGAGKQKTAPLRCVFPDVAQAPVLARVIAQGRTPFTVEAAPPVGGADASAACVASQKACRTTPYLIEGDEVATGERENGRVCAFYPGRGGGTTGLLNEVDLDIDVAPRNVAPWSAWVGRWRYFETEIRIERKGDRLLARGDAVHRGLTPASVNVGSFGSATVPSGNRARFNGGEDYDICQVELLLMPPYLIATDNRMCGGHNVSFRGVYRRSSR